MKSGKLMVKSQKRPKRHKRQRLRSKKRRVSESQGAIKLLAKQKRRL